MRFIRKTTVLFVFWWSDLTHPWTFALTHMIWINQLIIHILLFYWCANTSTLVRFRVFLSSILRRLTYKSFFQSIRSRMCRLCRVYELKFFVQMKRKQELENKCAVLKREVEILRVSVRQHKDKVQQIQELLTSREEAHRCVFHQHDSRLCTYCYCMYIPKSKLFKF